MSPDQPAVGDRVSQHIFASFALFAVFLPLLTQGG